MATVYRVALPAHGKPQASGQTVPPGAQWSSAVVPMKQAVHQPLLLKAVALPKAQAPTLLQLRHVETGFTPPTPKATTSPEAATAPARFQLPTSRSVGPGSGEALRVGKHAFELVRELGRGSFGIVWEVQDEGKTTLALKQSTTTSQQMVEACLLEAEILQQLSSALSPELRAAQRVPSYVAHCMGPAKAPGQSQVLLAMSRLSGRPLDRWLYGVDENGAKRVRPAELLDGPLPGGQLASRDLASAAAAAAALVGQLAPVLGALGRIAYHRDISSHNLLVRGGPGSEEFALIDFGLAVRSATWESDYTTRNISGDPRYFTPAAWMLLIHGHKYLSRHPDTSFLEQYRCRIDHFSFGVLVLEVFFSLWKGPDREDLQGLEAVQVQSLRRAWSSWRAFWVNSIRFFQMFHVEGPIVTRHRLARSQGLSSYVENLRTLCLALRAASQSMRGTLVSAVLAAAAGLIDPRGSTDWAELPGVITATSTCYGVGDKGVHKSSVSEARHVDARLAAHRRIWSMDTAQSFSCSVPELALHSGPAGEDLLVASSRQHVGVGIQAAVGLGQHKPAIRHKI